MNATVTIHNCRVFNNTATFGGGLYLFNYAGVSTLINSTVSSNTAFDGGGLYLFEGSAGGRGAVLSGNTVISNTANRGGGGLNLLANNATLINNIVADNRADGAGSGLSIYGSSPRLLHNTIARNTGGDNTGVYVAGGGYGGYSTVILTNTILVSHTVGISVTGGSTVTINDILWYNTPITVSQATTATVTVQNQHTGDPAFAPDGYHLTLGSAAIGKGVDAGVTTDIDGDSRPAPAGTHPDLGADEVSQQRVYLPLITRNYQP